MNRFRVVLVALCVVAAGLVVSAEAAFATPTPLQPPTLTKSFTPSTIPLNGISTLDLVVQNPNPQTPLTGVTFTDPMPSGVVITNPVSIPNACGAGSNLIVTANSITLIGATLPPNNVQCGIQYGVQGTTLGPKVNSTGPVTSNETGPGAPAVATLLVLNQPSTLTKSFSPANVRVGETTRLTFTLTNPNPIVPLSRITFADPFPPGLSVAANPAVVNNCGGVPSVGPFALAVAYANASLPPGGSCTFSVNVTAGSAGTKTNTTTIVSSSAGIGSPATGTLTVREL